MIDELRKIGFVPSVIDDTHFIAGGLSTLPQNVIRPDGNWEKFLPSTESQMEKTFDSYGCTVYGTLNAIETLEKAITNNEVNYSERFIYNIVGIIPPGSDPHLIATTIRGSGLISESDLPDETSSLAEFMTPRPMTVDLIVKGQKWTWTLGHEWIITPSTPKEKRVSILKEALLKGTVCISVTAWYKNNADLYYSPEGQPNEHWTMCYDVDETSINVFDSYQDAVTGSFKKRLTLDHNIQYAKRYSLTRKLSAQQRSYWFIEILKNMWNILWGIQEQVNILRQEELKKTVILPAIEEKPPKPEIPVIPVEPKYLWETPEQAHHSFRVICDESGLSVADKNLLCQVLNCESGFKVKTVHPNNDVRKTVDNGICQFNSYWYKDAISPEDALNDPEKACRLFIKQFKAGQLKDWVCYSTGAYKPYKP